MKIVKFWAALVATFLTSAPLWAQQGSSAPLAEPLTPISASYAADEVPVEGDPADAPATYAPAGSCCSTGCCDSGCCSSGCGCGGCGCQSCCGPASPVIDLFQALIAPSERCFCDFISPMTNPVFFEDPRTLTEARVIFIQHHTPDNLGGDDIQLYAMQLRAALTDRLSIVAAKDGYIVSDSPLVDDGWADISAGLKYNIYQDACRRQLISTGFAFEMPTGSLRSQQGNGDGEFHLYVTGMADLGNGFHWISGSGFRLPTDTNEESQSWYWSNHLDKHLGHGFYVLGEMNWYHWLKSGDRLGLNVEGGDLFNLGSRDVAGNDIVTGASA